MTSRFWKDATGGVSQPSTRPGEHVEPVPADAVPFNQLRSDACRWIFGAPGATALSCGKPQAGVDCPWCKEHLQRAYIASKPRPVLPPTDSIDTGILDSPREAMPSDGVPFAE
jgi:hypothetical protein